MRENRVYAIGLPVLLVVLGILACGPAITPAPPPEQIEEIAVKETDEPTLEPTPEPPTEEEAEGEKEQEPEPPTPEDGEPEGPIAALLGDVLPDEDIVNHGDQGGPFLQLRRREDLRDGDRLEILRGGVAEVLLEIGWEFYLFNKTRMGVELREGETIQETMLMESGTLLGRRDIEGLEEGDRPVIFRLPGGRSIIVSGTRFFVVLDDDTDQAIVGNFDGWVRVEGGGVSLTLPKGEFIRDWEPNQGPDQATRGTITFTFDEFMDWGYLFDEPFDFQQVVCNDDSRFIADVTIPDNTELQPGASFVKTWRIRNSGSCTWTDEYTFGFDRGDRLSGSVTTLIDGPVPPEETIEISIEFVAPEKASTYQGWWQVANDQGDPFGQTPFVKIIVVDVTPPAAPALLAPSYNQGFSEVDACPVVPLDWSEPVDESGIKEYEVEIWIWDGSAWNVDRRTLTKSSSYKFVPTTCKYTTTFYDWRVRAYDNAGNLGPYSPYSRFTNAKVIG
jgi:hypothetical protein